MSVLVISGLGPGHLEVEDISGCGIDKSLLKEELNYYYNIDGKDCSPFNLVYSTASQKEQVLRNDETIIPDMISSVLKSVLSQDNIDYEYVPIKHIWEDSSLDVIKDVDIVCLSTTFMWSAKMLDKAIKWIKKNCSYRFLILGGQYSTLKSNYIINNYSDVDYIIAGDGEYSLPLLIKFISQENEINSMCDIPNLVYKDESGTILKTLSKFEDIDELTYPKFNEHNGTVPYISMKGCPYSCKFCALPVSTPKWRYLSAERIIEDWKNYNTLHGVKHIDINDSTFFIPFERLMKVLKYLPDLGISWEANSRVNIPIDKNLVNKLEKANCKSLYFGFESMSEAVLGYINKRTTPEQNRKVNAYFKESKINTMMSFIVGFPGETPKEFNKTREYLMNEHYGHFNIYVFEFEDEIMPIWQDREKFHLQVFEDEDSFSWSHGGLNWSHCGMNSLMANKLRSQTIKDVRLSNSKAIHCSWQRYFQWPLLPEKSRKINLEVEKLIDRLIFSIKDFKNEVERKNEIAKIIKQLSVYGISPSE